MLATSQAGLIEISLEYIINGGRGHIIYSNILYITLPVPVYLGTSPKTGRMSTYRQKIGQGDTLGTLKDIEYVTKSA